jgi:predicted Zn-dependent peptidase
VRVAGGTVEDPPGKEGAAELLASLLGRGAGERGAAAFLDAVEEAGGTFSAAAHRRWLGVGLELLSRQRELGLELLADALRRPRLDAAELERERAKAVDALRAAKDEPESVIGEYWLGWLFRGHPFARPAGGDERTLPGLVREDVLAAAARALGPGRTWIAIAGDFDPAEMKAAVERRFGDWKAETPPLGALPPPPRPVGRRVLLVDKPNALQTYFRAGGPGFSWADPDWPARYLANVVLGGRFTSRLNRALRIESGLTYGAASGFDDALAGAFSLRSYTATPTSREAVELADGVYRRFRAEGITAAELASARNYIQGQYGPDTVETAGQVASMHLALRFEGLGPEKVDGLFAALDALTAEQVNRVIAERFPSQPVWVVIGQAEALREVVRPFGEVTEVELAAPGFGPGE